MNLRATARKVVSNTVPRDPLFHWHFEQAIRHYKARRTSLAIGHYEECMRINPDQWTAPFYLSIVYSQLAGDLEESLRLLRYARRLREQQFSPPEGSIPYRYLNSMWVAQIGHIANMEHLIKREILLGGDPKCIISHFPASQKPANQFLLDKLGAYITIARTARDLPYPEETMQSVLEDYFLCESLDGTTKHWWHASSEIFRAWESEGRAPLLKLTDADVRYGRTRLKFFGLPDHAWFACLHVREGGFKKAQGHNAVDRSLNAEVAAYLPAIRAVIERGGWVVRIGDRSMQPLPQIPRVIDYARSTIKGERMDLFLLGACRFFIGTSSGPAYVPPLFGVPCALTNWAPTGQRPFNVRDIYISKLYKAGTPARFLDFAEIMLPPVGHALSYMHAQAMGLVQIPNTPEEIREVVCEMLDRMEGTLIQTRTDTSLQAAFDAVADTNKCVGNARAGRAFLRRHSELLKGPGHHAA